MPEKIPARPRMEKTPAKTRKPLREMLLISEQAAETGVKVLPAERWALHYKASAAERAAALEAVRSGSSDAAAAAKKLAPDAILYDVRDLQTKGFELVAARIRELSAYAANFDYMKFARFVEGLRGHELTLDDAERLYGSVARSRIQKRLIDSYGRTGREQMRSALNAEAEAALASIETLPRTDKVFAALKLDWLAESARQIDRADRDRAVVALSGDERDLYSRLRDAYRAYVDHGDEASYARLVDAVREHLPLVLKPLGGEKPSETMRELEDELKPFEDQVGPPGTSEDPGIPPDDADEYHTPPPGAAGESREKQAARPIFEITPPLAGRYASGRKSYFDRKTLTWSKKKKLLPYAAAAVGGKRHRLSGALDRGLKSLPLPVGYALDAASLNVSGAKAELFRDQNGCAYIQADAPCTFSVELSKENTPFTGPPIPEDTQPLAGGALSSETEDLARRLVGSPLDKAEAARQHLFAHHFYPAGGDLVAAQALQYKLRHGSSSSDAYLANLDRSEYLECYSANTLFIHLLRRAGVAARLVVGHRVEGARKGKSVIDASTGHAWTEVWDGASWRRFDATPPAKPEDPKPQSEKDKAGRDAAPEADDNGVDSPQEGGEAQPGGKSGKKQAGGKPQGGQPQPGGDPTQGMSEASDAEASEAAAEASEAKQSLDRMEAAQKEMQKQVEAAGQFKDLEAMRKQLTEQELLDEMKEELSERLDAKEEQLIEEMKEKLDRMVDDGFLDEDERRRLEEKLTTEELEALDRVRAQLDAEARLYDEYENIREEVAPLVDKWFRYFAERLPRQEEIESDEDTLARQGVASRKAVMRPRNILFGTVKHPRQIRPSIKPKFLSSLVVDVSGSMGGEKLTNARKLLFFYAELFDRISKEFGYIRFSVHIFSDAPTEIKSFEHDYGAPTRHEFPGGKRMTIKARLMEELHTQGGTNMLDAVKQAADSLSREAAEYPDYASAMYFTGDGGDTCGNTENIRKFLSTNNAEHGFGDHMYNAIFLGNEQERAALATIFGDEHTKVAGDFDTLIERSMEQFEDDLEAYLANKVSGG